MLKIKLAPNRTKRDLRRVLGPCVIRRRRDGSFSVSPPRDTSGRVFSEGQLQQQGRFRQAALYAREAARTEPIYAERVRGMGLTAYSLAVSDWFNPPVIHQIEFLRTDGRICIQASDKVLVTKVEVMLHDEHGGILEQGAALRAEGDWWEYVPGQVGPGHITAITATAWDLAGNVTKAML
jgi:hypothetical protein